MNHVTSDREIHSNAKLEDGDLIEIVDDGFYIVARLCDSDDGYKIKRYLIGLHDGNRWSDRGSESLVNLAVTIGNEWHKVPKGTKVTIEAG